MASANSRDYNCPECHRIDRVDKVTALVSAGTATGLYAGAASGTAIFVGASQTDLSRKLFPPLEPTYQSPWSAGSRTILGILLFFVGFSTLIAVPLLLYGIVIGKLGLVLSSGSNDVLFIVLAIGWFIIYLIIRGKNNSARARRAYIATEHPRWQLALDRWNECYYCARNDVVFIPGRPEMCVPASQMSRILYS